MKGTNIKTLDLLKVTVRQRMNSLLLGLAIFSLSGCTTLPLPGWASNGNFRAYVPLGFFSYVDGKGAINIGMPEITNGVAIEKLSTAEEFQKRVDQYFEITRKAYPKDWITVSEINTLGHLKGRGFKILVNEPNFDPESGAESYLFLVESDGWWMISAVSQNANKASWRDIISSLRSKKS